MAARTPRRGAWSRSMRPRDGPRRATRRTPFRCRIRRGGWRELRRRGADKRRADRRRTEGRRFRCWQCPCRGDGGCTDGGCGRRRRRAWREDDRRRRESRRGHRPRGRAKDRRVWRGPVSSNRRSARSRSHCRRSSPNASRAASAISRTASKIGWAAVDWPANSSSEAGRQSISSVLPATPGQPRSRIWSTMPAGSGAAIGQVAAVENEIGGHPPQVGQDCLEGGPVAVNAGDDGDAHR